jgi:hypothetical protein
MVVPSSNDDPSFPDALRGLLAGDFSRLDPLFVADAAGGPCRIVAWFNAGLFAGEPAALAEALACACFNGRTAVAKLLLDHGVDPAAGMGTGMNAFHWAANRGQVEVVKLLVERDAPLETVNMYGGTVLGCAVWSAVHEPRAGQLAVIEALLAAGANVAAAGYPSGNHRIDELLRQFGATA